MSIVFLQNGLAEELERIEHEGVLRSYYLHTPEGVEKLNDLPLLLVLHGQGSNGPRTAKVSEFNSRADQNGFIVAYPEAVNRTWLYYRGLNGFDSASTPNETAFLLAVIEQIESQHNIDTTRVYLAGISNGGLMAQRAACDEPEAFAATASVAAGAFFGLDTLCVKATAMPIVFFHGTHDNILRWDGTSNGNQVAHSIPSTMNLWSTYNGCSQPPNRKNISHNTKLDDTSVVVMTSDSCKNGAQVKLYGINGGGHNWPGVQHVIPEWIAGKVNMDIHASDEIWKFFQQFHR